MVLWQFFKTFDEFVNLYYVLLISKAQELSQFGIDFGTFGDACLAAAFKELSGGDYGHLLVLVLCVYGYGGLEVHGEVI